MKKIIFSFHFSLLTSFLFAQADSVYLFCYFKGNGDGLHYATSENGLQWTPLFNDSVVLKPTVREPWSFGVSVTATVMALMLSPAGGVITSARAIAGD